MKVVGIKYCGGCNPEIDRPGLVERVAELLSGECVLETGEPSEPWDVAIFVCGCPTACLDRRKSGALASKCILVSGSMVDARPVPAHRLAAAVIEKLRELGSCSKGVSP